MTNNSRYEVTAPMPHFTHLFKGDILYPKHHALAGDCWGHEDEDNVQRWVTFCPDYPHLFRLLKWWEHVPVDELPKFLKRKRDGIVVNVKYENGKNGIRVRNTEWDKLVFDLKDYTNSCIPATEAEYTDYLNKLNAK